MKWIKHSHLLCQRGYIPLRMCDKKPTLERCPACLWFCIIGWGSGGAKLRGGNWPPKAFTLFTHGWQEENICFFSNIFFPWRLSHFRPEWDPTDHSVNLFKEPKQIFPPLSFNSSGFWHSDGKMPQNLSNLKYLTGRSFYYK